MSREDARSLFRGGPERLAVGFFGRIEPEKGIQQALAGCASIQDLEWHIFGGGTLESRLREAYRHSSVYFHGRVDSVADAMLAMDVIVIPSQWDEAFPFVALEAMSLGLPIVASRVGGLPEAVEDRVTGLLVPKDDPSALRAALKSLASDSGLRLEMGRAARERYRERFTLEAMLERYDRQFRRWLDT
jgi:glycosyltransferase involved in cell wall biosynthesis